MSVLSQLDRLVQYFISLLIILLPSTFLFSQITVTQSEFLKVITPGNPLYMIPGESGLINIGNYEGPNIYDFSHLDIQNQFTLHNYEVSQIPEMSGRYPSDATTFGEGLQNIDGFPIFYSITDSTFLLGDVTIGDEDRYTHYLPYELFTRFPLNYGDLLPEQPIDVYDTTYNSTGQVLSTDYYRDFVDVETYGYGTLKLPDRELDCLRMIRKYSWFNFKEIFFITNDGVLLVVSDVGMAEPDTGYVNGDYVVLSSDQIVGIDEGGENIPVEFSLDQNYPNPFNPRTRITYVLPRSGFVLLTIYDSRGRSIQTLVEKNQTRGSHSVYFVADHLASGIYFYQLKLGSEHMETKKMVLMR